MQRSSVQPDSEHTEAGADGSASAAGARGPGRPRVPDVDQRILDAALGLMARSGYMRMSIDAVAAAAGVTKPTIYRRYPNKIRLALAAIVAYCEQEPPAYSGATRDDLVVQMRHFQRALDRPNGMALLGTVLAEEHETPELLASFRALLVLPRRQALRSILERAHMRGELDAAADLELAANMLIGAYYAQYLGGAAFEEDWAERIVDAVLASIGWTNP